MVEIKDFHQTLEALQLHFNAQLLVQRVNHLLPSQEGSSSRPRDAPTLTMELGSPVSDVSLPGDPNVILLLAWSPFSGRFTRLHANNVNSRCDHTSQAFPGFILLLAGGTMTGQSPSHVAGGGGACGGPAASLKYTVSQYQWVNHMFGGSGSHPGDAPTLTMELCSPVRDVSLQDH